MQAALSFILALALAHACLTDAKVSASESKETRVNPLVASYIQARIKEFDDIKVTRVELLRQLADYVKTCRMADRPIRLTFICTHNSRRSQLAQVWAATAAAYFDADSVTTYSGGTEATAFNPRAVATLERAGFVIERQGLDVENPRYRVSFQEGGNGLVCFSKLYGEKPNPNSQFCAVLTCSEADAACPLVSGASRRVALPYDDPKVSDDTATESATYDERCAQIAREMLVVFSLVK